MLYYLFMRQCSSKDVCVASLAEDLDADYAIVAQQLRVCDIAIDCSQGFECIRIPSRKVLNDLLLHHDFHADVLELHAANYNGETRLIDRLVKTHITDDGCVRFRATWFGKYPTRTNTICCHQLNSAARYYVCFLPFLIYFSCFALQVEHEMRLRLPEVQQPDAISVAAVPEAPGMFRVSYSDGSCSEALPADQLKGIARLLLAQSQPPGRKRKRKPSRWLSDLREIARRKRAQRAEQQRARRAKKRKSQETESA